MRIQTNTYASISSGSRNYTTFCGPLFSPVRSSAPAAEAAKRRPPVPVVAHCCKGHPVMFGTDRRDRCGHFAATLFCRRDRLARSDARGSD